MAHIDWEATAMAALNEVATDLRNEESNANRIASEIGKKIGKDRNADVEAGRQELQRSEAKAAGISQALEVMRNKFVRGDYTTLKAQ